MLSLLTTIAFAGSCELSRSGTEPCRVACDKGDAEACSALGFLLETGHGLEQPPPTANEMVFHSEFDDEYGGQIVQDIPKVNDVPGAVIAYGKGCALGDPYGCVSTGVLQNLEGPRQDKAAAKENFSKAFHGWTAGCARGDGRDCQHIAASWWGNWGHAEDARESYKWSARACELNDGRGCWAQANALIAGEVVPRDLDLAEKLHIKSCDAIGEIVGCLALEDFYGPKGERKNPHKAKRYRARSCSLDEVFCQRPDL